MNIKAGEHLLLKLGLFFAVLVLAAVSAGWPAGNDNGSGLYVRPEFSEASKEQASLVARRFIESSASYSFDGRALRRISAARGVCRGCWNFVFAYDARYEGYGDRQGQILSESPKTRLVNVSVEYSAVARADIDAVWDLVGEDYLLASEAAALLRGETGIFRQVDLNTQRR